MNTMLNIIRPDISISNMSQGPSATEYQRNMLCVINFYEQHLNNFKGLIMQQNKVIDVQSQKMKVMSISTNETKKRSIGSQPSAG